MKLKLSHSINRHEANREVDDWLTVDNHRVSVLASGGIDSTALIDFYLRRKVRIKCVHFQYGQPCARSELIAVKKICKYYNVQSKIVRIEFPTARRKEEIIFRNLLFILGASSLGSPPIRVAIGIHADSLYYDCTKSFLDDCQRILDGYFSGTVRIEAPFIDFRKADILKYCQKNGVPLSLTYSCQNQNYHPCGKCSSCRDRKKLAGSYLYEHKKSL
ncbi:MAG: ATPase [Hadesarchaea archaeon]|nr:ATPase [Hadesarchaea archaeon]